MGQALVEFALVAPVVLLIIGATVDMGRGLLLYTLLQGASRDTARQATLAHYNGSNLLPPTCTGLATPCPITMASVIQGAHALDPLGVSVVYADSPSAAVPPNTYPGVTVTYTANGVDPTAPGTVSMTGAANNTVYVFIYEFDPKGAASPNPRWGCSACGPVRTTGHQLVVVDLKLVWQPVLSRFLGIPSKIAFDSQTVDRLES
ncbi:MAG: TadE/TadG family type IV pilus assembly protein [Candidatus Dormiibacterota bacterium]